MKVRVQMRILSFCLVLGAVTSLRAMEHVTLRNGFELDCVRREVVGERVRLYLNSGVAGAGAEANFLEVAADAVVRVELVPGQALEKQILRSTQDDNKKTQDDRKKTQDDKKKTRDDLKKAHDVNKGNQPAGYPAPTAAEMHEMLAHAGVEHRVDADLLASVVRAESGGRVAAVSRVGARGLMQLMPTTAAALGVKDAFVAQQNIDGGSAYLDSLLTRYHDDMAIALAAYNAGPAAVDRWHGVPPYRETRAYVARVIREFNRRKLAER